MKTYKPGSRVVVKTDEIYEEPFIAFYYGSVKDVYIRNVYANVLNIPDYVDDHPEYVHVIELTMQDSGECPYYMGHGGRLKDIIDADRRVRYVRDEDIIGVALNLKDADLSEIL